MTDNRSLRHADRAPATFSDDDPLAELARIASEFEAAAPSDEREAADYSDDAMAFDLEAELMRSFESDAAHARLADESDRAELPQGAHEFGEAANQDESAQGAPVSDLTPEEIPAFLKSRPAEDAAEFDETAPEDKPYAEDIPAEPARAEDAQEFATAEDVTAEDAPSAPRNDDIADEWTDLPEWPQARSSARRASPAEPIEKIDLGPPTPVAEPSVPAEPNVSEIEPEAVAAEPEPAAEPVAAVDPAQVPLPEDDLPPPIERVSEEAHENHDIIRSFSDHHDDWAEIEEQEDDIVEPTQWADNARGVIDEPASANEPYAGDDPVDSDPIWRDFQNYAVPSQAAPVEPESAAPAADPVDEWDIAADLEHAFSDYDDGRTAAAHDDDRASEDYEPAVAEDVSHDALPAALVVDEARWDSGDLSADAVDEAEMPVAHVPYPDEHVAPFEALEPLDADEAVIGDIDAGYAAAEGEAALDAPAEADALRIDEDDMAAMAIDFDDLELEMQTVAATLGDEPASQTLEPTVVAEPAPPPGAPAVATPPISVRQPEPAHIPEPRLAPHVVAAVAPAAPVVAARESDLVFDTGEVTDTSTFIEPVAALDIPDLPEVETPPAAAVDPDMSELEAEFADILATEPPQRAQAEPAPTAATPDSNFDFANYEFADFDSYPTNETRDGHGAGAAGAAAIPADLAFDDFENDAPAEVADRSGGGDNRKWVLLAGGLVLLAGVSFAGYAFMGGSSTDGGAPPVIAANDEPYKVVPEDPGGRAVPNQDQAVYDRVAGRFGDGNANLVSRTEEPIDVVQRTLDPQVLPLEGRLDEGDPAGMEMPAGEPPAEASAPQATTVDGLLSDAGAEDSGDTARFGLEPRVVSTMVVRPDGTLVPADSLDADAGGNAQETASAGDPAPAAPLNDPEARLAPATEIEDLLAPPRSVETTTLTPEGEPAAAEPAAPAAPEQERASAEPDAGSETAAAGGLVGEGAAFSNPGGYVVQIASQPSEESARSTYQSLSGRYASIIGDRQAQIQAADIPDRGTFYRVRVAGGTRDEAVALCERYQAAGGSCFVAQ